MLPPSSPANEGDPASSHARAIFHGPALAAGIAGIAGVAGVAGIAWRWGAQRRARREMALHRVLVELLLNALSAGDATTERHSRRVAALADALHTTYQPGRAEHAMLRIAALLHDMGKIDDRFFMIVHSRERLTPAQRAEITGHPAESARILEPLEPFHTGITDAVRSHHERWDGGGYPGGLAGADIPLASRVITAADVFDAMTQSRPYQAGRSFEEGIEALRHGSGSIFDPEVIERVQRPEILTRWRAIYEAGRVEEAGIPVPSEPTDA